MENSKNPPQQIVLLRGLGRSSVHWGDFLSLLKKKCEALNWPEVLTPDLPGNGSRSQEVSPHHVQDYVQDLEGSFSNLTKPFVLVGISLGGMVATEWARVHPDRISKLVLINSSGRDVGAFYDRLMPKNYLKLLHLVFLLGQRETPARNEQFEETILQMTAPGWAKNRITMDHFTHTPSTRASNLIRQLWAASRFSFGPHKPVSRVKILVGQKDSFVNPRCSLRLAQSWGLDPIVMPEAGHDLPLTHPHWLLKQIFED